MVVSTSLIKLREQVITHMYPTPHHHDMETSTSQLSWGRYLGLVEGLKSKEYKARLDLPKG
jgi:hypothetical protein